jgi:hypothetical protein
VAQADAVLALVRGADPRSPGSTFLPRRSMVGWQLAIVFAVASGETALIAMRAWRDKPRGRRSGGLLLPGDCSGCRPLDRGLRPAGTNVIRSRQPFGLSPDRSGIGKRPRPDRTYDRCDR